jgi:glycosidase
MEFHISRAVRQAANVDDQLFSYAGNVVFANVTAARKLTQALNEARGPNADPATQYNAGALFAMGLIDELSHALVARYRREIDPKVLGEAVRWFGSQMGPEKLNQLLLEFTDQFPDSAIYQGKISAADWLRGITEEGASNREAALEELLLLFLANSNPAFKPFKPLFEDKDLKQATVYPDVTAAFPDYFATRPPLTPEIGSLFTALRAPILASPDSLTGQLDFIREHWAPYLGEDLRRVLLAIDTLREEDLAIWMRFHPPGPDNFRHGAPTWGDQGFIGDEFVGFDEDFRRRRKYSRDYQAPLDEYEAFSTDQAWMPNVVLMAKSTYVWLEQLSKKYGRHIHRLDQIPDEELRLLADRGITGLWLIGLWERSVASRTIKRLRGSYDAVASAYSLKSYDIAEDLGGWTAYEHLKQRAAAAGMRLASDMVPNHMGIDSPWVIDNPDWFLHRWESPFPSYSFNGPDLSTDSRVEIKLEDHYYDQTDAAVVFRLRHHADGATRYVYHGNDGTTFAWNDTAQLDYSKAAVREHVIQVILHVARLFPIIRFDAAMVLAKRHVQRLWFPLPGAGGSIPSRAENAMSQEEFDSLMPHEFWREVVDRVATEVPGTLLLAEAFWMLEGYFVRTLGMHRVYNSAFMNMLRDEENAKYRSYLKKTIEFDPDILKRYVNFMSNPDERTAIDQFGDGDKCFGVATLMATLPGLPMFGHGQIEGFTERYGMEYKQAKMEEWPRDSLVGRHMREIAPLLKKRYIFAGSENFVLYDFWTGYGTVNENVFAYSNRHEGERSLVLYNNKYDATDGTIHISVGMMNKGSGELRQRNLAHSLALPYDDEVLFAYRDHTHNLEYLQWAKDIHHHGLHFDLGGFQTVVLLNWRELRASEEYPWDRLCNELHGQGVPSLDYELVKLRLRPLHHSLASALSPANIHSLAAAAEHWMNDQSTPSSPRHGAESPAHGAEIEISAEHRGEPLDPHLSTFTEGAASFFDLLRNHLPLENRKSPAAAKRTHYPGGADSTVSDSGETRQTTAQKALMNAARLPLIASSFSTDWPPKSRPIVPTDRAETRQLRTWAPIVAWVLMRQLPGSEPVETFDRLLLRHALADIFASLGMEGDARWQAAAQVRLLLTELAQKPAAIHLLR